MKDKRNYFLFFIFIALFFSSCTMQPEYYADTNTTKIKVDPDEISKVNNSDFIDELPLHDAVRARDLDQVKLLINNGSQMNERDIYGYTPLHLAVRLQEIEILNTLIANGSSVNNTDIYEDTPLLDSTRNDYTIISKILICNGAHRNVKDSHDMSPLHNSSKNKNLYISKLLLSEELTPYCKKLGNKIVDLDIINDQYRVCGKYKNDINASNTLDLMDSTETLIDSYGSYNKWCSDMNRLEDGLYVLQANAKDIYERNATDKAFLDVEDDITELYTNDLKITIDDLDTFDAKEKMICGDVVMGDAKEVKLALYNFDTNETYGLYDTNLSNHRWCSYGVEHNISYGKYMAKARGIDEHNNTSVAIDDTINYYPAKFSIDIDGIPDQNTTSVKICGDIVEGEAKVVHLNLIHNNETSTYHRTAHSNSQRRWCTGTIENLEDGRYIASAKGFSVEDIPSEAKEEFNVLIPKEPEPEPEYFIGLYDALMEEFKDDFEPWNAELTKDELLFRFKNPNVLFTHGDSDIKEEFTNILSDFFPRYLKILVDYRAEIDEVAIEGHTSSIFRRAKNDEERWLFNKRLSDKRAKEVREYSVNVAGKRSEIDQDWISDTFKPYGRSYDNLIYNEDGTENASASRRVEFRIKRKENVDPVMLKVE